MSKKIKKNKPKPKIGMYQGIPMPIEREQFASWANRLDYKDFKIVTEFVSKEIELEIDRRHKIEFNMLVETLDRNITAAMILETDFDLKKIHEIFKVAYDLVEEDQEKVRKLKEKGEDLMKKYEKKIEIIRDRTLELIYEGANQKKAIEVLAIEFPMFSKAMLTNAYKKIKEEIKKDSQEEINKIINDNDQVADAIEYIFEEEKEVKKDIENQGDTGLVVINKKLIMDIAGEFGTYHIEDLEVKNENNIYNSEKDVNDWFEKEKRNLEERRVELLRIYKMINLQ